MSAPQTLSPGMVLGGKYRLVELIGAGGMSRVWRASHETLGQPVAVKLIETIGDDIGAGRERFLREARIAAAVRHRNVVSIVDFGTTDDGAVSFMVMELLEGESMAHRLARPPTPAADEISSIVEQMLGGLAAVHDAGIVHRDLKPENVFLVADADGVYPKLLDFGISRAEVDDEGERRGRLSGTPAYMSPEQARGNQDLDRRTDVYAAGVVLYEGLTGIVPYDADDVAELLLRVRLGGAAPLDLLRPDLGKPIADVVARALALDREERFADAREMRDALRAATAVTARSALKVLGPARRNGALRPSSVETLPDTEGAANVPVEAPALDVMKPLRRPRSAAPWAIAGALLLAAAAAAIAIVVVRITDVPSPAGPISRVPSASGSQTSSVPAAAPAIDAPQPAIAPPPHSPGATRDEPTPVAITPRPRPSSGSSPTADAPSTRARRKGAGRGRTVFRQLDF